MSRIYVRTTGNDGTGDGSVLAPFLTIAAASQAGLAGDVIDVGPGTFREVLPVALLADPSLIVGAGHDRTVVRLAVPALHWLATSGSGTVDLGVADLSIEQIVADLTVCLADGAVAGRIAFCRVAFRLQDGYAAQQISAAGPQVDLLNCSLRSLRSFRAGAAFRTTTAGAICARNTLFSRLALVTDDADGGLGADIDYCSFYDNERELRVGQYGPHDLRDVDPMLSAALVPAARSPLRNAGLDLSAGYGAPLRFPPAGIALGHDGPAPEIGPVETLEPSGAVTTIATHAATLLGSFGREFDRVDADLRQQRLDGDPETAQFSELQRRFAAPLGAYRPAGMTIAQYRAFLIEVAGLLRESAPSRRAVERIASQIYPVDPIFIEHDRARRFVLDDDLKLSVVHAAPSDNSLTVRVSAGELQLANVWYRVAQTDVVVANSDETYLYVDGDLEVDGTATVQASTDPSVLCGWVPQTLTGTALFRLGSRDVAGIGTAFLTELSVHDVVEVDLRRYVVDEVLSDTLIRLRTPFLQDDQNEAVVRNKPAVVIGSAVAGASTVTLLRTPGRLGRSTFADARASRAHAFDVVLTTELDSDLYLLLRLLDLARPVHKLVAVSSLSHYPSGRFASAWRRPDGHVVDYAESGEDWPEA